MDVGKVLNFHVVVLFTQSDDLPPRATFSIWGFAKFRSTFTANQQRENMLTRRNALKNMASTALVLAGGPLGAANVLASLPENELPGRLRQSVCRGAGRGRFQPDAPLLQRVQLSGAVSAVALLRGKRS